MTISDWLKLVISVLVVVSVSVLIFFGKTPAETGMPIIAAIAGYAFGNAHAIVARKP